MGTLIDTATADEEYFSVLVLRRTLVCGSECAVSGCLPRAGKRFAREHHPAAHKGEADSSDDYSGEEKNQRGGMFGYCIHTHNISHQGLIEVSR